MYKAAAAMVMMLMLFSCTGKEEVYMKPLDGAWAKNNVVDFSFEIKDAELPKNIIFVVRNNDDYPYSNLWLISSLKDSQSKKNVTDSLNFVLAEPNGKWIGSGFGETKETLFQYKINYKFPANGRYNVSVRQGMRREILPGIEDLGLKIENAKP